MLESREPVSADAHACKNWMGAATGICDWLGGQNQKKNDCHCGADRSDHVNKLSAH